MVWEKLCEVGGDSVFVDADFNLAPPHQSDAFEVRDLAPPHQSDAFEVRDLAPPHQSGAFEVRERVPQPLAL